jgi:hypothetical protein
MKKLRLVGKLLLAVVFVMLLAPGLALAAEAVAADGQPFAWWSFLLATFTNIVVPIAGTALTILVIAATRKLLQKFGLEASAVSDDLAHKAALKGVAWAEEWANNTLKNTKAKPPGAEKLTKAVEKTREFLQKTGLEDMAEEKLTAYIESAVNVSRPVVMGQPDPSS